MNLIRVYFVVLVGIFSVNGIYGSAVYDPATAPAKCAVPKFQVEFENSAAVFVGEVIADNKSGNIRTFDFKIVRYWKGIESTSVKVAVHENPRFEAFFESGGIYLIFAKKNEDGSLFDGRCSRSAEINGASSTLDDDLEALGDAKYCIELSKKEGN